MNPHPTLAALQIGETARTALKQSPTVSVLGSTSRGIFLLTQSQKVIFLSYEDFSGPLTIRLGNGLSQLAAIAPGQAARFQEQVLTFPDAAIEIHLAQARVWQPPPPPMLAGGAGQCWALFQKLAAPLLQRKTGEGFTPLLAQLAGHSSSPLPPELQPLGTPVQRLGHLFENSAEENLALAGSLLGRGRGLTPSGDDLIAGLLLLLNRAPGRLPLEVVLQPLCRQVCSAARQKTTSLSASLIECAAEGSADERLLETADGLLTARLDVHPMAARLESYGQSSGVDALVGMGIGLLALASVG